MNDSCTQLAMDARPQERGLVDSIIDKFVPDKSAQEVELCQSRNKTPYKELNEYTSGLARKAQSGESDVYIDLQIDGHTMYDINKSGNNRLLYRTTSSDAYKTTSETAYKYDDGGKLTEVLEHSSSPKFETMRKTSLTPNGWREEQWNRYGTQFNKMPTITGQTEFSAQADGSVLRVIRTTDTPMGAVPIGRPTIEMHTIYDAEGRSITFKRQ